MGEQIHAPGLLDESPAQPLKCAVTVHNEQVVLHFSEPRECTAFLSQEALMIGARLLVAAVEADKTAGQAGIDVAMSIIDAIYELRGDIKPAAGAAKHELIERHRRTLTQRVALILRDRRETKALSHQKLAKDIVEKVLHEIFA